MNSARRIPAAVVVAVALLVTVAAPARAAGSLRSGTIVATFYPFAPVLAPGPGPDCTTNVDCLPWLIAGCPSEMTGIDPALHTSIVDVRELAGKRKTWTFTMDAVVDDLVFGGVSVQLWSRSCTELSQIGDDYWRAIERSARFKIPKGTRWMTVAAIDTPTLTWTLR
jgi:hypothetical protein